MESADVNTWFIPRAAVKPSLTSRASTIVPASDPDLQLPVDAGAAYSLKLILHYDGAAAADLLIQFAAPAATAMTMLQSGIIVAGAANTDDVTFAVTQSSPWAQGLGCFGAGVANGAVLAGTVVTGANAGTLALQWSQGASSATPTILHAGCMLMLERIG